MNIFERYALSSNSADKGQSIDLNFCSMRKLVTINLLNLVATEIFSMEHREIFSRREILVRWLILRGM